MHPLTGLMDVFIPAGNVPKTEPWEPVFSSYEHKSEERKRVMYHDKGGDQGTCLRPLLFSI